MVKLELAHKEALLLILDYLSEHNLVGSMLALENEAKTSLYCYSQEITFLRALMLEGNWQQIEHLLHAVASKGKFDLGRGIFYLVRQQYLEMLAGPQVDKQALQWVV